MARSRRDRACGWRTTPRSRNEKDREAEVEDEEGASPPTRGEARSAAGHGPALEARLQDVVLLEAGGLGSLELSEMALPRSPQSPPPRRPCPWRSRRTRPSAEASSWLI